MMSACFKMAIAYGSETVSPSAVRQEPAVIEAYLGPKVAARLAAKQAASA